MFRLAVLTILFIVSYGYRYPPKQSYQPAQYQAPPPPPPPPPMPWYPYPPFPWMDWWDDDSREHHSHSREHDRDRCRRLGTSCWNTADCSLAIIRYFHEGGRKRASIRCPNNNQMMSIVTPDNSTLSAGIGAAKIVTCRHGRWQALNTNGYLVRFSTVRCLAATSTTTSTTTPTTTTTSTTTPTTTTSTTTSTTTTTPTTTTTSTTTPTTTTTSTTTSTTTTTAAPSGRIH